MFNISHLAPCTNGDLRLVGGNVNQEGRVEICIGNVWGTVCDDYWGNTDAQVACGKLGYPKTGILNIFSAQHSDASYSLHHNTEKVLILNIFLL